MSNMQNFISYLKQYSDVARASRFKVYITGPREILSLGFSNVTEKLSFQCESAELPGRTLSTFEARTYGPSIKYPQQTSYGDINLTFFCTGNQASDINQPNGLTQSSPTSASGLWEKRFFDSWMNTINPSPKIDVIAKPSYNMEYKVNYASEIEIVHYDVVDNKVTYSVKLIDAFPTSVNQLSLNWAEDSALRLTVTFAYTRWEEVKTSVNKIEGSFQSTATNDPKIYRPNLIDTLTNSGRSLISGATSRLTNII